MGIPLLGVPGISLDDSICSRDSASTGISVQAHGVQTVQVPTKPSSLQAFWLHVQAHMAQKCAESQLDSFAQIRA